jgi:phage shock protein PspC (stress-responsive transcriptional regulator)/predicted membrane protein
MSENPAPESPLPPPPPPPAGRGRLTRSRDDRMIAGVAGGLGRYAGIDPVIVRILLVVLVLFGGAGLLLYLAAVLLVPSEDEVPGGAPAGAAAARPSNRNVALIVLGVVVLCLVIGPIAFVASSIVVPLLFLVLVGLAVAWLVTGRRPQRDAVEIAKATLLGLGVMVLLFALAVGAFWGAGVGGDTVVAAAVIAAGVAVVVAAFFRPARWLVLPALALAIPAGFVSAAGIDLDGGYGERDYRPGSITAVERQYEIGAGQLTIDLRGVDFPRGDTHVDIDVGMGEAVVIVPDDLCVASDTAIGMGQADVFSRGTGGVDVDYVEQADPPAGRARLVLDTDIGLGHLDLRKTDPGFDRVSDRGPFESHWDNDRRGSNDACAA